MTTEMQVRETKAQKAERERAEAREQLLERLSPGDKVWTVVDHVSSSGMTRWIRCFVVVGGDLVDVSWLVAPVVQSPLHSRGHLGVERGGCGMDMGFDLVYSLARALWPGGFACVGERCPSNDHVNGDRDYTPGHVVHSDGGYAVRQVWL